MSEYHMQAAREYAAQPYYDFAKELQKPDSPVVVGMTDARKEQLIAKNQQHADEIIQGVHDNSFVVRQRIQQYLNGNSSHA